MPATKKAPKVIKRRSLQADSAQVAAQFERIAKAYSSLGSFSVTAVETQTIRGKTEQSKYTAYFGADGRLGLKIAQLDGRAKATGGSFTMLYDGREIITSANGELEERSEVKNTTQKSKPALINKLFSNTVGAQSVGVISKYHRTPEGYKPHGTYSIQALPAGKTHVKSIDHFRLGEEAVSGMTDYTVGASGLIEKVETNTVLDGTPTFHAVAILSRPVALSTGLLTWEKFGPPPNPNFSLDAPSRAVFERAAKLYGEAKSFTTTISGTVQHSDESVKEPMWTADIAWERRGRLRLQSSRSSMVYAFDGTNSHIIADGTLRKVPTFTTTPAELTFQMLQTSVPDDDPFVRFPGLLANLLQGKTTDFTRDLGGIDTRKVTLETGVPLNDTLCDVVNVLATVKSKTAPVTLQDRYWFTQSEGRLLRVASSLTMKDEVDVTDVRLNGQKIDAPLPDSTWVLTAPTKKP